MPDPETHRHQIEDLWRARLNDAKLRLDFARQYMREVQEEFSPGEVPAANGFAFHAALRAENFALMEYERILGVFADLVVAGKVPVEEYNEWPTRFEKAEKKPPAGSEVRCGS